MKAGIILSVQALRIQFDNRCVIHNLSFDVDEGDNVAIIGPNGAGKTVLLKALLGLLPYEGEIRWSPGVRLGYVLLFLPALLTMSAQAGGMALASAPVGILLMSAGLGLEACADWQKSEFKKRNPSRFCDVGLYSVVRFPNYFGEMVFWLGVWVSAMSTYRTLPTWALGSLGFLFVVLVMVGASRRLELKQSKNYGSYAAYEVYSRRVPILFPFLPIYSLRSPKVPQR